MIVNSFSAQNSTSLSPASFLSPRPKLHVMLGSIEHPTFALKSPISNLISLEGAASNVSCKDE